MFLVFKCSGVTGVPGVQVLCIIIGIRVNQLGWRITLAIIYFSGKFMQSHLEHVAFLRKISRTCSFLILVEVLSS